MSRPAEARCFDATAWYVREAKALAEQHSPVTLIAAALFAACDEDWLSRSPISDLTLAVDVAIRRLEKDYSPQETIERAIVDLRETFRDDPAVRRATMQAALLRCGTPTPEGAPDEQ